MLEDHHLTTVRVVYLIHLQQFTVSANLYSNPNVRARHVEVTRTDTTQSE